MQEYWSGLPFSLAGDIPDPGIKPVSPALAGGFFTTDSPGRLYHIYRKKKKNKRKTYAITSIDEEEASDKMEHIFKIKAFRKVAIEEHFPNMIKGTSKISKKTRMPTFTTAIQHNTESSSQTN